MLSISEEQLSLYISLFRGRNDIYARRWENSQGYFMKFSVRASYPEDSPNDKIKNITGMKLKNLYEE